jgi:4-hydroxybenzoate polyprenyltransferase
MNGYKSLLKSKTFWGNFVSGLVCILAIFGFAVSESDQSKMLEIIVLLGVLICDVVSTIGRIVADKKIG